MHAHIFFVIRYAVAITKPIVPAAIVAILLNIILPILYCLPSFLLNACAIEWEGIVKFVDDWEAGKLKRMLKILFLVIVGLAFVIITPGLFEYFLCYKAVKQTKEYIATEYLRIKIYGSSETEEGDTISGTFSIVDSNGNEIAVIERSWKGAYLAVEFVEFSMENKKYIFPATIFGRKSVIYNSHQKEKGVSLEKYYNENGECILPGVKSNLKERVFLYRISHFSLKKNSLFGIKHRKTIIVDLSSCQNGKYYSIIRSSAGYLFVQEL